MRVFRNLLVLMSCAWCIAAGDGVTATAAESTAPAQPAALLADPTVLGQWSGIILWPDKAVHSIMLRTGKVLWFKGEGTPASISYTWDPVTNAIQSQVIGFGVFCSGHSLLPDGRVLVEGGRIGLTGTLGPRYTVIFDPLTEQWSEGPQMRGGRYYPTNLVLGDGRTLVFSGYDSTHTINETVESFLPGTGPGGTDQWELIAGANHYMGYYPRFHLLPSGLALKVGHLPQAEALDPATGTWTNVGTPSNFGGRKEGTSVLLPPGFQKIMIMGGGTSTNTAEILDLSSPSPGWTYTPPMKYGRNFLNSVILPDGTVLVAGGSTGTTPVYPAEIYDPAANTWTEVAAMDTSRLYHSSALLLPDGRAMWAGTDNNHTAETYSPPYLFRGARPVIDSSATSVPYGASFRVRPNNPASITSVVFMRPGSTTHSQNMEQRYVPLSFALKADGALQVQAPTNPNTAPPGYYMLFILNGSKVPSVAKFVHLGGAAAPIANRPPTVFAGGDQTITRPASAILSGSVTDDALPNPPGAVTSAWRKVSGPGTVTFGDSLSVTTTASFSVAGTYQLSLTAFDGALTTSDVVAIAAIAQGNCSTALDRQVASSADDAEENPTGGFIITSPDLELVDDGGLQTVGVRFAGVTLPQGATITNAYLQFTVDEAQSEPTTLTIFGQAADSATTFAAVKRTVSSRPRTAASVAWSPAPWGTIGAAGPDQRTPDLSSVIQEIVNRPQWAGRSLAFIFTGTGHRTAKSFDLSPTSAAQLHVEFACLGSNLAPVVDAGPDQTITLPASATIADVVSDDGLPNPPGEVTETWSKVSGPGTVTFQSAAAALGRVRVYHGGGVTTSFSQAGTYVLRLTASDGALSASDDVTVVVNPAPNVPQVLERSVASLVDDAEERASGAVWTNNSDLELVTDGVLQVVGLRFAGIAIPPGATITNAWVQFMADEAQSEPTSLTINGQNADNAASFSTANRNISLRPRTTASASWAPAPWTLGAAGPAQRTPDLSQVIQAIVARPGWVNGNALALIITGTGHRTAEPFEGSLAPLLHIEFTTPATVASAQPAPGPSPSTDRNPSTSGLIGPLTGVTRFGAVFPNPGAGPATVRFELARETEVSLEIFDVRGALVRRLVGGRMGAGMHEETWDGLDQGGRRTPNGVYLVHFAADRLRETRKLVVLARGSSFSQPR